MNRERDRDLNSNVSEYALCHLFHGYAKFADDDACSRTINGVMPHFFPSFRICPQFSLLEFSFFTRPDIYEIHWKRLRADESMTDRCRSAMANFFSDPKVVLDFYESRSNLKHFDDIFSARTEVHRPYAIEFFSGDWALIIGVIAKLSPLRVP